MTQTIVLGDDIGLAVYLKTQNPLTNVESVANIAATATIKVALIADGVTKLSKNPSNSESFTNKSGITYTASWSTGLIVATFTAAQTRTLSADLSLQLEVTVDDGGITTWPIGTFESYITKQDYTDTT